MAFFEFEIRGHNEINALNMEDAERHIIKTIKDSGLHDVTIFIQERAEALSLKELAEISEDISIHRLTKKGN